MSSSYREAGVAIDTNKIAILRLGQDHPKERSELEETLSAVTLNALCSIDAVAAAIGQD